MSINSGQQIFEGNWYLTNEILDLNNTFFDNEVADGSVSPVVNIGSTNSD
jgi:hypothetical protein